MVKTLLVFEDFKELTVIEMSLKKIGFDIVGLNSDLGIIDQVISFNPSVVVICGKRRVSPFSVSQKLRDYRAFDGKVIVIVSESDIADPEQMIKIKVDALLEAPVDIEKLVRTIARLQVLDTDVLIEKLSRYLSAEPSGKNIELKRLKSDEDQKYDRKSKYEEILKKAKPVNLQATVFEKSDIKKRQADLKKDWDFKLLKQIDILKKQFVAALFKKDKKK